MTSLACQTLFGIYQNPNGQPTPPQDGLNLYGDATVLFQGCASLAMVDIFNQYCGIPTNINALTSACKSIENNVQDNGNMIFNKLISEHWNNSGARVVPQFASRIVEDIDQFTTRPDIQSSYDGSVSATLSTNKRLYQSNGSFQLLL